MGRSNAEWAEWAREHRVAYEIAPLLEMRGSEKLQIGFTLSLYAEAPMEKTPGAERRDAAGQLKDELLAFLERAFPADARVARTEMEPPRTLVLRPENEISPSGSVSRSSCRVASIATRVRRRPPIPPGDSKAARSRAREVS